MRSAVTDKKHLVLQKQKRQIGFGMLAALLAARITYGANTPVEPVPAITDAMMQQFVSVHEALPADAPSADAEAAAAKTSLGAPAYHYIEEQIELMHQESLRAADAQKADENQIASSLIRFGVKAQLDSLAKNLPPDQIQELRDKIAKEPELQDPARQQPTTAVGAFPTTQSTVSLFTSELEVTNRKVIRQYLPKVTFHEPLTKNARKALEELKSDDMQTKHVALAELAQGQDRESIPYLVKALDDPRISVDVMQVLGSFRSAASGVVPQIIRFVIHAGPGGQQTFRPQDLHSAATQTLVNIGVASVSPLYQALSAEDPSVRAFAANTLAALFQDVTNRLNKSGRGKPEDLSNEIQALDAGESHLIPLLSDPDPSVRAAGVSAVIASSLPADQFLDALVKFFSNSPSAPRMAAIKLIGQLGPPAAPSVGPLATLVSDRTPFVAPFAAESLAQIGPAGLEPLMGSYGQLQRPGLKIAVLGSLGELRQLEPDAGVKEEPIVESSTQDPDAGVRLAGLQLAATTLNPQFHLPQRRVAGQSAPPAPDRSSAVVGQVQPAAPLPQVDKALLRAMQSPVRAEQVFAAQHISAISSQGKSDAITIIQGHLQSSDSDSEVLGLIAVKSLGPAAKPLVPAVVSVLNTNKRDDVARSALQLLGEMGPDAADAIPLLNKMMDDPNLTHPFLKMDIPPVVEKLQGYK